MFGLTFITRIVMASSVPDKHGPNVKIENMSDASVLEWVELRKEILEARGAAREDLKSKFWTQIMKNPFVPLGTCVTFTQFYCREIRS